MIEKPRSAPAPDSSVLIAGFVSSHQFHQAVLPSLADVLARGNLIAHTVAETYAVLSAPGGIYRSEPRTVLHYLQQFLGAEAPIPIPSSAYRRALDLLVDNGRPGGAIYDALIALAALDANATLVSLDRRAAPTYELCGADVRFLGDI
ncbi:MAG: PIN domain-containing protein [Solirubrobacterales bacterium]